MFQSAASSLQASLLSPMMLLKGTVSVTIDTVKPPKRDHSGDVDGAFGLCREVGLF